MKISIVVVAWRSRDPLASCLESLALHAPECRVVVVDNASEDGTPEMVRHRFPQVIMVSNGENIGFAAGCNLGASHADGDAILFLNPDVRAEAQAVPALASALAADPTAAATAGLLLDPEGTPQERYAPRPLPTRLHLARNVLLGQRPMRGLSGSGAPRPVAQAAGACLMVRRDAFQRLGGFDERFRPVFFEDVDLCLRLQQDGRRLLHVPEARFTHEGAASLRRLPPGALYAAWFDNMERYAAKHHGAGAALMVHALSVPGAFMRLAASLLAVGPGRGDRRARARALLGLALRNISQWHPASQSTS